MLSPCVEEAIRNWPSLGNAQRKQLGRELRSQGFSYREIQELVPVSKGTLSGWCRGLSLDEASLIALRERSASRVAIGSLQAASKLRSRNDRRIEDLRSAARVEAMRLRGDPGWLMGLIAYWCEGAKDK